jgi:ubiquinone biosynthesis protein UbiJ
MIDPALHTAGLSGLEFLINRALTLDPATKARLGEMQGLVLEIHCESPELKAYCLPGAEGLELRGVVAEDQVSASLSGKMSDFIQLLQAEDKAAALVNGRLAVAGDSGHFLKLQAILAELDLDWEQALSKVFGDVASHQIGRFVRGALNFGQDTRGTLERHVEEFIHEEARLLPPRLELENFYADVRKLHSRSERLQARIERLKQRLEGNN